eukprot:907092_1
MDGVIKYIWLATMSVGFLVSLFCISADNWLAVVHTEHGIAASLTMSVGLREIEVVLDGHVLNVSGGRQYDVQRSTFTSACPQMENSLARRTACEHFAVVGCTTFALYVTAITLVSIWVLLFFAERCYSKYCLTCQTVIATFSSLLICIAVVHFKLRRNSSMSCSLKNLRRLTQVLGHHITERGWLLACGFQCQATSFTRWCVRENRYLVKYNCNSI